jgi:hypothetical protein
MRIDIIKTLHLQTKMSFKNRHCTDRYSSKPTLSKTYTYYLQIAFTNIDIIKKSPLRKYMLLDTRPD